MKYDLADIAKRVQKRKNDFLGRIIAYALVALGAILGAVLVPERKFVVPAGVIIVVLIFAVSKLLKKYKPSVLYSGEVSGVNIKEHEIMGVREGKPIYRRFPNTPHNYSNHKNGDYPKHKIRGSVYMLLDDGNIFEVANLNVSQLEFYEDGDKMVKPAGARFPQVVGREVDRQVCPICGRINRVGVDACLSCGLLVLKETQAEQKQESTLENVWETSSEQVQDTASVEQKQETSLENNVEEASLEEKQEICAHKEQGAFAEKKFIKKTDGIYQLRVPFMSVYTSIFLIEAEGRWLLVDCATTRDDVDGYLVSALSNMGLTLWDIDALFLTHRHSDHSGGLERVLELAPCIKVVDFASEHSSCIKTVDWPLSWKIVTFPLAGHTADSVGVLDLRSGTLISGDGIQGAGIGRFRCLVSDFDMYFETLLRIGADSRIANLLFSHAYEPWFADMVIGREAVLECLNTCRELAEKKKAGFPV